MTHITTQTTSSSLSSTTLLSTTHSGVSVSPLVGQSVLSSHDALTEAREKHFLKDNIASREAAATKTKKFSVSNLNFYYGQFHALKNISMDITSHEITAFIGPSGCGKSTFLKTLNRMNDLEEGARVEGSLYLDGLDIYHDINPIDLRHRVGMVFQQPNPFPKSIYDNVAFGPRLQGITKRSELDDIVETSLRNASIWNEVKDRLHKSALGLSGGQQQRLCIARTLATQPEVILMDEPTSALDPIATANIEELVMTLKDRYTIVIVTHNMQQAARISDKTAFFFLGDLIEYDVTNVMFTNPAHAQTEAYITGRFG